MQNYLICNFINGLGNHLFIYIFGKLVSKIHKIPIYHDAIPVVGVESNREEFHKIKNNKLETIILEITSSDIKKLKLDKNKNYKIVYQREIENFRIYKNHLNFIRNLFKLNNYKKNDEDLVIHFRAGNDFLSTCFFSVPEPDFYYKLLKSIKFKKLYIVTNSEKFNRYSEEEYLNLKEKLKNSGGDGDNKSVFQRGCYPWVSKYITNEQALNKINKIFNVFNNFKPIWINKNMHDDFHTLCKFNRIIIAPSTFSWWAAILSDPKIVYCYRPWKNVQYELLLQNEKKRNLGKTNYTNWIHWGDVNFGLEKYTKILMENYKIDKIKKRRNGKLLDKLENLITQEEINKLKKEDKNII